MGMIQSNWSSESQPQPQPQPQPQLTMPAIHQGSRKYAREETTRFRELRDCLVAL